MKIIAWLALIFSISGILLTIYFYHLETKSHHTSHKEDMGEHEETQSLIKGNSTQTPEVIKEISQSEPVSPQRKIKPTVNPETVAPGIDHTRTPGGQNMRNIRKWLSNMKKNGGWHPTHTRIFQDK